MTMNLDEAIKHAEDIANECYAQGMLCHANPNDEKLDDCIKCGKEHEQLAEWLEELKEYRAIGTVEECAGYKINSQNISRLHNCNDCCLNKGCKIKPKLGEHCRINCYLWKGGKDEQSVTNSI